MKKVGVAAENPFTYNGRIVSRTDGFSHPAYCRIRAKEICPGETWTERLARGNLPEKTWMGELAHGNLAGEPYLLQTGMMAVRRDSQWHGDYRLMKDDPQ